jgi:type I restriction enzyme, S subunit
MLAELATDITDGDHMPPPKALQGVPFITIGNIAKETRTIDFSDTFMVSRDYFDGLKANKKPQLGDVLYTVTGSFGVPVFVSENREFCFQRRGCKKFCVNGQLAGNCCTPMEMQINDRNERTNRQPAG